MLAERESDSIKIKSPLDFEKVVHGGFLNFNSRHHVFDGFESSSEFREHVETLLDWQVEKQDGLHNLGVEPTEAVQDLEYSMGKLV